MKNAEETVDGSIGMSGCMCSGDPLPMLGESSRPCSLHPFATLPLGSVARCLAIVSPFLGSLLLANIGNPFRIRDLDPWVRRLEAELAIFRASEVRR